MIVVDSIAELRKARQSLTGRVGLVPTMGYLHDGHISLVDFATRENDGVIATIFVNPTQFAVGEDLSTYPRDLPRDLSMLEKAGVELVFTPTPELMYPARFQTYVTVEQVTRALEGAHREGHFRGVTTVVSKLFNLTQPDVAYFGQKDAQQVVVIKQMVRDLNFPLEIAVCPIIREADGLAMSSRNVYLSQEERKAATVLYRAINGVGDEYNAGERDVSRLKHIAENMINGEPIGQLDYVSFANAQSLDEVAGIVETPLLMSMAVQFGRARLIDNCILPLHYNTRELATTVLGIQ